MFTYALANIYQKDIKERKIFKNVIPRITA